jgi:homoserine dehydrogenase
MTRSASGTRATGFHLANGAKKDPHLVSGSSALSLATASAAGPDTTGFRSSGQSPGQLPPRRPTIHLVGPGQVGREFLRQAEALPARILAISDSTATVFDREGLDTAAIVQHKQNGGSVATLPRAERIATELAIGVVGADIVVDATPTSIAGTQEAVQRGRAALRGGSFLCLCGKNALAAAAPEWLLGSHRARLGIQAVLGGAGQALLRDLDELRAQCSSLALVGNVTTTVIVQAIEAGASIEEGIAAARERGLLEPDPTLDLDGSDAATKLGAVFGAVFGESWLAVPPVDRIEKQDLRSLDVAVIRERVRRGATTRLVARASRDGSHLRACYEELPLGSPLAAPPDRVVYGYELPSGLRVHTGLALGYSRTAGALVEDVTQALRTLEVTR